MSFNPDFIGIGTKSRQIVKEVVSIAFYSNFRSLKIYQILNKYMRILCNFQGTIVRIESLKHSSYSGFKICAEFHAIILYGRN